MSEVIEVLVKDIAEIKGRVGWKGYTVEDLRDEGALTIGAAQIDKSNKLDLSSPIYLSDKKYEESPEIKVEFGDILIVQRGSLGKVVLISKKIGKATINPSVVILKKIKVDRLYLYYILCSDQGQKLIVDSTSSTGVPMISQIQILNFKFKIHKSLPIQQKITKILSTIDGQIEKTETIIAKYKAAKQGMLQDLFTRGIDVATGELRPKYEDAPELYKDSPLGMIPKDWEEKNLSDMVEKMSPITYGIVQPGNYDPNGVLLIRGQDYISGWATEPEFFKVSNSLHKQFVRSKTVKRDILMCIVGATFGAIAVVPDWITEANITQTTARIRVDQSLYSPLYIEYYLKSEFGRFYINKYVKGSAQPGLNLGDVDKFRIRFPHRKDEQVIIGDRLRSIDETIVSEQEVLGKMKQLKAGLMNDILTGKVEVTA